MNMMFRPDDSPGINSTEMGHFIVRFLIFLLAALAATTASAIDVSGTGSVYRAVDGDTFWITGVNRQAYDQLWSASRDPNNFNPKYQSVKIRIGGVDTAESVHTDQSRNSPRGNVISEHMKSVSADQPASFRCWDVGKYGRPICAIQLKNIGDIGLYLIEKDFSTYVTRFGNHPYYDSAYRQAGGR